MGRNETIAPGKPGIAPTWCSSRKDMVTTGLGSSRVWATVGHGILNEVYWPSTGRPQIRDLGFIVAKGGDWWEVKKLGCYTISTPRPYVLIPIVYHEGDGFRLTLEILCDDLRDVVLIRYRLEGDGHRLYTLLAPRLGSRGDGNTAWSQEGVFFARGADAALCLCCQQNFCRQSAGYVGSSDGWQDFQQHGEMTWEYERAEDGNVAVMGELEQVEGVLALGFGASPVGAKTQACAGLADSYSAVRSRTQRRWETWGAKWTPPPELEEPVRCQVERCTAVLKCCEDRLFPGAIVASLSIPWGDSRDDLGGYHLVWARDSVQTALAMIAVGHYTAARQLISFLIATQQSDGRWVQSFFPSGEPWQRGTQLDEAGLPVLLAAKLFELEELHPVEGIQEMILRALGFLVRSGPVSPQDRWEESEGLNAFTIGVTVAAIVGAAPLVADEQLRAYLLSYADYLNQRIEDWLYAQGTPLAQKHGVEGHYLRLASRQAFLGGHGEISLANVGMVPATSVVALDYMYLARLGLRSPQEPAMLNTLRVVESELRIETPHGPSYYRYNGDRYGENDDGTPFDGCGKGRLWPLLTGERGHLAVQSGEDASGYLRAMSKMSGKGGLIPEQVWDTTPIPERGLFPGQPTGSAMPLVWAHAEFVKLARCLITGRPIELLRAVADRYQARRPRSSTWHWRSNMAFLELPAETDLLIEDDQPFVLHYGFDDWHTIEDRNSKPLGLGMHGVRFAARELRQKEDLNFTLHYPRADQWEHVDHTIRLAATVPSRHLVGNGRAVEQQTWLA